MRPPLAPVNYLAPHARLRDLLRAELPFLLLLNTFIAICISVVSGRLAYFPASLAISQCIGCAIYVVNLLLRIAFTHRVRLNWPLATTVLILSLPFSVLLGALLGSLLTGVELRYLINLDRDGLITVLAVLFGSGAAIFYYGHRIRLAETQTQLAAESRAATEAQLRALQAQIEPHFLFNTLANLDALIAVSPTEARQFLAQLNRYLRASLKHAREETSTLGDELAVLDAYLSIMQTRMGERFRYRIDCPDALRSRPLPPMLLQPLVENALRHGIEPAADGGELHLRVQAQDDGSLQVDIDDTGLGLRADYTPGTGLSNVRERLARLYGPQASLELSASAERGTAVRVRLPGENSTQ